MQILLAKYNLKCEKNVFIWMLIQKFLMDHSQQVLQKIFVI